MKTISERIKSLRFPGETQAQFAERLGTTQASISRYINGRQPDRETLIRIAQATGTTLDWLLTGKEPGETTTQKSDHQLLQAALSNLSEISTIAPRDKERLSALIAELVRDKDIRKEILSVWESKSAKGRK